MSKRLGGWIQTYNGTRFWPLDPFVEDNARLEQHHYNGVCLMTWPGHRGAPDCLEFNLAEKCEG